MAIESSTELAARTQQTARYVCHGVGCVCVCGCRNPAAQPAAMWRSSTFITVPASRALTPYVTLFRHPSPCTLYISAVGCTCFDLHLCAHLSWIVGYTSAHELVGGVQVGPC